MMAKMKLLFKDFLCMKYTHPAKLALHSQIQMDTIFSLARS